MPRGRPSRLSTQFRKPAYTVSMNGGGISRSCVCQTDAEALAMASKHLALKQEVSVRDNRNGQVVTLEELRRLVEGSLRLSAVSTVPRRR